MADVKKRGVITAVDEAKHASLSSSVDRRHLTKRAASEYHDVVFCGQRVWAMWDTGSSFTLVTKPLAEELGLQWVPFMTEFQLVSGSKHSTVGVIRNCTLRLHPRVELTLAEVRVLDSTDMNMILGQDVIGDKLSGVWRRKGINTDGGKSFALYEVGKPPDVVLYSVRLY